MNLVAVYATCNLSTKTNQRLFENATFKCLSDRLYEMSSLVRVKKLANLKILLIIKKINTFKRIIIIKRKLRAIISLLYSWAAKTSD